MAQTIRVLVIDGHTLVREGLTRILAEEADIQVIGSTGDGTRALEMVADREPDVVILDATLPTALEIARQMVAGHPRVELLALALDCRIDEALALLENGAAGYLCKNETVTDLVNGVRHVSRGEMVLGPAVAKGVVDLLTQLNPHPSTGDRDLPEDLTEREADVLQLLCQGDSDKQIADALHISPRTVQGHLRHIYAKLGVHSRTEAMHLALERGWVTLTVTGMWLLEYFPPPLIP